MDSLFSPPFDPWSLWICQRRLSNQSFKGEGDIRGAVCNSSTELVISWWVSFFCQWQKVFSWFAMNPFFLFVLLLAWTGERESSSEVEVELSLKPFTCWVSHLLTMTKDRLTYDFWTCFLPRTRSSVTDKTSILTAPVVVLCHYLLGRLVL